MPILRQWISVSCILFLLVVMVSLAWSPPHFWGFYGHRQINRYAVFTLPQAMLPLYKKHIEFITAHAVDPDKRRYAFAAEGPKHYIDLDYWGTYPFDTLPRNWREAKSLFTQVYQIAKRDTLYMGSIRELNQSGIELGDFLWQDIPNRYFEIEWTYETFPGQKAGVSLHCHDLLYEQGVLPYQLVQLQQRLTESYEKKNLDRVLRYSAEIGHYVADAHVPLHTTVNYNGQLTDQLGIHAFWESRIPELFAADEYNHFVGRAEYIRDPQQYYWQIVLDSHVLVDSVLQIEARLKRTFPKDKQYCFDQRLERTVRIECEAFAKSYEVAMKGMVEERWQASIRSIGDVWYSAWVDAGKPDLASWLGDDTTLLNDEDKTVEKAYETGKIQGREHD